jgi:hypothetical protein
LQRVEQIRAVGLEGEFEFRSVDGQVDVYAIPLRADHCPGVAPDFWFHRSIWKASTRST